MPHFYGDIIADFCCKIMDKLWPYCELCKILQSFFVEFVP